MPNPLTSITATQVKVIITYVLVTFLPGIDPDLRASIIGAVTALYILGTTIYKSVRVRANTATAATRTRPNNSPVNSETLPAAAQAEQVAETAASKAIAASETARPHLMDSLRGGR